MAKQNKPFLLNDLEAISDEDDLPLQSSCTIYKVPHQLRRVNPLVHTPNVVSIGPYHSGDSRLESMQELKIWYFKKFIKRITRENAFNVLYEVVKEKEGEIRRCYSEIIEMSSDNFVKLIVLDASFIIEFLYATCDAKSEDDPWSTTKPWISYVMLDLVLLENQIPFFVLEILSNLATFPNMEWEINSFVQFAVASYFIKHIYPGDSYKEIVLNRLPMDSIGSFHKKTTSLNYSTTSLFPSRPCHFCDFLRSIYGSRSLYPRSNEVMKFSYGASQLQDVGLKFEVDDNKSIADLECSIGQQPVLKIPSMKITCWTEILWRNIVAFEQCHYPFERFVTDYIILLNCLINTEKDLEILVEKRIMHTLIDKDKVAAMVNTLSDNVSVTHMGPYTDIHQLINKFYGTPLIVSESNLSEKIVIPESKISKFCGKAYYKNKATFVRDYWSTPWKKLSLLGGIALLVLTFIQTICSIISLTKQ